MKGLCYKPLYEVKLSTKAPRSMKIGARCLNLIFSMFNGGFFHIFAYEKPFLFKPKFMYKVVYHMMVLLMNPFTDFFFFQQLKGLV